MFQSYPDIVSVDDLRRMLGIGKSTAYHLVRSRAIKSIRIGRLHRIPKADIIKYLESRR